MQNSSFGQARIGRRSLLASAAVIPLAGTLASCAGSGAGNTTSTSGSSATSAVSTSPDNPFGVAKGSSVDAVIFNGGYGVDYAQYAAKLMGQQPYAANCTVTPTTTIATTLQPRFNAGNPPDVIDDSGANLIGIQTILSEIEDLTDVFAANNLEGTPIKDTLYGGVTAPGTYNGKFAVINYVMTVYALWYSQSMFDANGWKPPTTWDEAYALGQEAKAKNKYLFLWGKEAATYYQTTAIGSAIKEGGNDVRLALENLKPKCWSLDPIQQVFTAMKKIIDAGMVKPGGSGTQFTQAQAQWSSQEQALLYPSGSWIENEMKSQTKAGFKMTGTPELTVTKNSQMPATALHATAGEGYIVPTQAKNVAGGKEFMRVMLSKDAATNFAKTKLAPTIVKGTVPADGFGSTALVSQIKMLDNAATDVFSWQFVDYYGMNADQLVLWNTFLGGGSSVKQLTAGLQQITDKIANDPTIKKITVS
ncbi:MAG: N-acetylglucosamine/diacetylchitobiose ABC transporter substrate-binding protein [Propionibacterium sp.]|nr:N-acetylglucosamine/diacetylchitobiose ABC transporter substrate-binding protein [Propionibacterium sp.]